MKSPSSHFVGLSRTSPSSPLFPSLNRGATGRRALRRRALFQRNGNVSRTSTADTVDVSPASSDVCRPAADDAGSPFTGATAVMDVDDGQLIGDFSRPCSLPVVHGKHADLQSISPDTVTYESLYVETTFVLISFILWLSLIERINLSSCVYCKFSCNFNY